MSTYLNSGVLYNLSAMGRNLKGSKWDLNPSCSFLFYITIFSIFLYFLGLQNHCEW